jgi:hypothetical protein
VSTSNQNGHPVYRLWNEASHRSILVVAGPARDPQKAWVQSGEPMLTFECGTSHCALAAIWAGQSTPAYAFPRPKLGRDEPIHTALVAMRSGKGE